MQNRDVEDAAQIVKALAVHRFCSKEVRIIVEVLDPLTQASAVWDQTDNRVEVVCPIKYHYKMMARRYDTSLSTVSTKVMDISKRSCEKFVLIISDN